MVDTYSNQTSTVIFPIAYIEKYFTVAICDETLAVSGMIQHSTIPTDRKSGLKIAQAPSATSDGTHWITLGI